MSRTVGFDYSTIAIRHKGVVADHAKAITSHLRNSTLSMINIGRRLIAVRTLLGVVYHAWIRAEFQWSQTTAKDYIQATERFGGLDCLESFQPYALIILSRSTTPEAAVKEAIAHARSGVTITKKFALELIDKHNLAQAGVSARVSRMGFIADSGTVGPDGNFASLIGSLKSVRNNLDQISQQMSAEERRSLADELVELARQIRPVSTSAEKPAAAASSRLKTAPNARPGSVKKARRPELASA